MKAATTLHTYGRKAFLFDNKGNLICESRCLIQPLRYKNKLYLEGIPTDIGTNEAGCYLFLAPPEFDLGSAGRNGYVSDGENDYHIDRYEKIYLKNKVYFIWAIIRARIPDTYPTYNHFV